MFLIRYIDQIYFLEIIRQGATLMTQIRNHRAFSLLSMRRKQINQRGSPARAAAMWCLVEEIRLSCEGRWNDNIINEVRPFRDSLNAILGRIKHSENYRFLLSF